MTSVAALRSNNIAHLSYRRSVRYKIKSCARGIGTQVKLGQVTGCIDPNRVCGRLVKARWRTGGERVLIPAAGRCKDTIRLGGGLSHRAGDRTSRAARNIVDILLLA